MTTSLFEERRRNVPQRRELSATDQKPLHRHTLSMPSRCDSAERVLVSERKLDVDGGSDRPVERDFCRNIVAVKLPNYHGVVAGLGRGSGDDG